MNEQVFWLRGHPTGPAFSRLSCDGSMGLSSLVTAAQPPGIDARFPILLQPWLQALNQHLKPQYVGMEFKELRNILRIERSFVKTKVKEIGYDGA